MSAHLRLQFFVENLLLFHRFKCLHNDAWIISQTNEPQFRRSGASS